MRLFLKTLRELPRNAKLTIYLQPLWSIPFFLYSSYLSLYMMEMGISPRQIGLISSASFLVKTAVALLAGYIIDRLGRKKALVTFDVISWLLPILLWAIATEFWHFLLAGIINSVVVVNGIVSNFFLVEDIDKRKRLSTFSYMETVMILSGFFVPISGFFFKQYSFVPVMRFIFGIAFFCVCIFITAKIIYIRETSVGHKIKATIKDNKHLFRKFPEALKFIFINKYLRALFFIQIIITCNTNLYNLFFFPLLKKHFSYTEASISAIPFVISLIILLILVFVIPQIKNKQFFLLAGLFLSALGGIAIISAPKGYTFIYLVMNIILWAASKALINPILHQEIANVIDDDLRANIMGAFNIISMVAMLPVGIIGGTLFEISPILPFMGMTVLYILSFSIYAFIYRFKKGYFALAE